jgi:SAM-dependent methyltransferase
MATQPQAGLPFPQGLHRSNHHSREAWMASARFSTDLLATTIGRPLLEGAQILDVGCGTKIVKALLDDGWPVARYVGIDVSSDVIDWLQAHVSDARFSFHHMDALNELYNPGGVPLGEIERLPVGDEPFDVICLFSVFTHLAPDDFVSMLKLLRPHLKPAGKLVFSVFLTDPSGGWARHLEQALQSDDPEVARRAQEAVEAALANPKPGFVDEVPETPLLRARYDRQYARSLVEESRGWTVDEIAPPNEHIQNYFVCSPR